MSSFFKDYNLEWFPPTLVIFFLLVFTYIVIQVFKKTDKSYYENASKMPLDDGENNGIK